MAKFIFKTHISAPPEIVFSLASDLPRAAKHIQGIERIELLTDGPINVGTRFRETRIMFGKESTEELEVTHFDEPKSYTVECDSCGAKFIAEYSFVADIAGTHVRLDMKSTPVSFMAKLMSPFSWIMMGPMKKCIEADLEDLKVVAETQAKQELAKER